MTRPGEPQMYGVILVAYEGMGFMNMWVVGDDGAPLSFLKYDEAKSLRDEYEERNPKGIYEIRDLTSCGKA